VQRFRRICVITHNCQSERTVGGFSLARRVQKQSGLRLLIPIDDDELKRLTGNSLDCGDSVGTGFCLDAETGQNLAKVRSRPLVGGKQKAAKIHAYPE
jgi:hypothetical protein